MKEKCYRYVDVRYAPPVDEFDNPYGEGRREIELRVYPILRRTPKGFWVDLGFDRKKIVNLEANKRFACLTKEDAMASYLVRKKRQVTILSKQLRDAETFLRMAKAGQSNDSVLAWGFE